MNKSDIYIVDLRENFDDKILNEFIKIYNNTFTDTKEREDPGQWHDRLKGSQLPPQPQTHLLVALSSPNKSSSKVIGGVVFEYYRICNCGLLTYIVVEPSHRHKGIARTLISHALKRLRNVAEKDDNTLLAAFAEVENPQRVSSALSGLNPQQRLHALSKLGARWIDIPYVQPQLIGGSDRCRHLLLLTFAIDSNNSEYISNKVVRNFLYEFYQALGIANPEKDADFIEITLHLNSKILLKTLPE